VTASSQAESLGQLVFQASIVSSYVRGPEEIHRKSSIVWDPTLVP